MPGAGKTHWAEKFCSANPGDYCNGGDGDDGGDDDGGGDGDGNSDGDTFVLVYDQLCNKKAASFFCPGKCYNVLGTNKLIEKMKVDGLSRKRNYSGRWDELIKQCTECFNQILDLAAKRRR